MRNYSESREIAVKCRKKIVESRYHNSEHYYVRDERLNFLRKRKRHVSRVFHQAGYCSDRMDSFSSLSTPEKAETATKKNTKKIAIP